MLTNPRDAIIGSVELRYIFCNVIIQNLKPPVSGHLMSLKMTLFWYGIHNYLLLFPSSYGSISCRFFLYIWFRKYRNLEIRIRDHSMTSKLVPFNRLVMVFYYCSIETLTVRHTVVEKFTFEKYRDLETGVKGHWRSLKMSKWHYLIHHLWLPIKVP